MKRRLERPTFNFPVERVRGVLSVGQLAGVGAVAIAWNNLEVALDYAIAYGLALPEVSRHEITGRLHGVDGKIAIARLIHGETCLALPRDVCISIDSTLSAVGECKVHRDAVVHAKALHGRTGDVLESSGGRGRALEILFTAKALSYLLRRTEAVCREMTNVCLLFDFGASISAIRLHRPQLVSDLDLQLLERDFQLHARKLRQHQKERASLPKLPAFPT